MNIWDLPTAAQIGGKSYSIHTDYRDILNIFRYLDDPEEPEYVRWHIALALFYEGQIPPEHTGEAMEYLSRFLNCGDTKAAPGPKLLDWEQDARVILSDVNKVAGQEIRALPYLHWWTFLAWFHAIGEGQLSSLIAIRQKLQKGQKLESWEQEYYRTNKAQVDLRKRYSAEELAEQERLQKLLGG